MVLSCLLEVNGGLISIMKVKLTLNDSINVILNKNTERERDI